MKKVSLLVTVLLLEIRLIVTATRFHPLSPYSSILMPCSGLSHARAAHAERVSICSSYTKRLVSQVRLHCFILAFNQDHLQPSA
jgi:hypothetical protein